MTTYIIDEIRCAEFLQRDKPDVIEPKTEQELKFGKNGGFDEIIDENW